MQLYTRKILPAHTMCSKNFTDSNTDDLFTVADSIFFMFLKNSSDSSRNKYLGTY